MKAFSPGQFLADISNRCREIPTALGAASSASSSRCLRSQYGLFVLLLAPKARAWRSCDKLCRQAKLPLLGGFAGGTIC